LLNLINDVLDMSNLEHGSFKLSETTFDSHKLFESISETIGNAAKIKQQTLVTSFAADIPRSLTGDIDRLKQVSLNLLENAVKFTPEEGTVNFAVSLLREEGEDVILQVNVIDSGIGISKEHQKELFNAFEQVDSGYSSAHNGIGLGLALSKRLIEMMGGELWVVSDSGEGAEFRFTCKLKRG